MDVYGRTKGDRRSSTTRAWSNRNAAWSWSHEFGHFLADYEAPRERIRRRLGPGLLAVLDGKQNATPAEQLGATLAGVELGAHVHFMDRAPGGTYSEAVNLVRENGE